MNDAPIELFTIVEAARLLSLPEGWLRKRVSARSVPHTRLGKHVRFTADQIHQLIAQGETPVAMTHAVEQWLESSGAACSSLWRRGCETELWRFERDRGG